jgi:hypothetical protein
MLNMTIKLLQVISDRGFYFRKAFLDAPILNESVRTLSCVAIQNAFC